MQRQSWHLFDLIPQCRWVHWLSFCVAGTPLWERDCSILHTCHATHMQHTCNTHATHMQHDMQHELFTCKFTVNVQDLTFAAPTPVLNGKCRFLPPRPLCLEIYRENARVACVLHVCCMCVAVAGPYKPDSAMSLGALAVVLRGRRATLRAWLLYPAHLPCNAHATHMQHTCNTHATHMQHDMQHELFTCKFTVNVQDLTFVAPTPVLEWKV